MCISVAIREKIEEGGKKSLKIDDQKLKKKIFQI